MNYRITKLLGLIASVLFLASCATAYQPRGVTGGYTEITPYEENGLLVIFTGNGYTSEETARSYAKYRAAELARDKDWQYIRIKNKSVAADRFETRLGAGGSIGQPVVVLHVTRAANPDNKKVKTVAEILQESTVVYWTPLETTLALLP